MTKLTGAGLDRELAATKCGFRAYLLYGPDVGLAQERADLLTRRVVADPADPFNVALFSERDVIDDPVRLADELAAQSLLGGRRVVRVREAGDRLGAALAGRLPADDEAGLLIVEAGELTARSALRKLFEDTAGAAAIACYPDEGAALAKVIDGTLAAAGLTASPDARGLLGAMLGTDRRATRSELAKLVDYMGQAGGQSGGRAGGHVGVEEVEAVIADDGSQAVDALAYAALTGEVALAVDLYRRLEAEGTAAVSVVRSFARLVTRAMIVADRVAQGVAPDDAVKSLRPPLFFKDAPRFRAVLRRHSVASLRRIQDHLWATEKLAKSTGYPDSVIAGQLVLRIAAARERGEPRGPGGATGRG